MSQINSCCCPCFLLGNITTKLAREKPFTVFSCCPKCAVGSEGCKTCCYTCCLMFPGWPVAPCCLSWHLRQLRYKLHLFYENDSRLKRPTNTRQQFYFCCCWASDLSEQYQFVSHLYDEGDLTFKWDFDLYRDQLRPKPVLPLISIVLVAPPSSSTSLFKTKLMQSAETRHPNLTDTNLLPMNQGLHLEDIEHVSTTIRTINMNIPGSNEERKPVFLELWHVPPNRAEKRSLHTIITDASRVFYLYDPALGIQGLSDVIMAFSMHRRLMMEMLEMPLSECEEKQVMILLSPDGIQEKQQQRGASSKGKRVHFSKDEEEENEEKSDEDHSSKDDDTDHDQDSTDEQHHGRQYRQRQPFSSKGTHRKNSQVITPSFLIHEARRWIHGGDISSLFISEEDGKEEKDRLLESSVKRYEVVGRKKALPHHIRHDEDYRELLRSCLASQNATSNE